MFHVFRRGYGAILAGLLLILAMYPIIEQLVWVARVLDVALILVIAAALARTWDRRGRFWSGLALGLGAVGLNALSTYTSLPYVFLSGHLMILAFQVWLTATITWDISTRRLVTVDSVLGAGCIYLLIALSWAHLYTIVETLDPGAFSFPYADTADPVLRHGALLYFSLITCTTVGFGDITPVAFSARYLAAVEGIVAQLFLVIVMARIVSLEISHSLRKDL